MIWRPSLDGTQDGENPRTRPSSLKISVKFRFHTFAVKLHCCSMAGADAGANVRQRCRAAPTSAWMPHKGLQNRCSDSIQRARGLKNHTEMLHQQRSLTSSISKLPPTLHVYSGDGSRVSSGRLRSKSDAASLALNSIGRALIGHA